MSETIGNTLVVQPDRRIEIWPPYPDSVKQRVDLDKVQPWMQVKGDGELQEIERLPKDGKRYEQGNLVILISPQGAS